MQPGRGRARRRRALLLCREKADMAAHHQALPLSCVQQSPDSHAHLKDSHAICDADVDVLGLCSGPQALSLHQKQARRVKNCYGFFDWKGALLPSITGFTVSKQHVGQHSKASLQRPADVACACVNGRTSWPLRGFALKMSGNCSCPWVSACATLIKCSGNGMLGGGVSACATLIKCSGAGMLDGARQLYPSSDPAWPAVQSVR